MLVRCEGGTLDGRDIEQPTPEPTISQNGLMVVKVHQPYPKRKGEKVTDKLLTWTERYHLHQTEAGPVYRCESPFNTTTILVGGETVWRSEGGAFHVYADRDGKLHAQRPEGGA
jgi:hypothetical protein